MISLLYACAAVVAGLFLLVWSADRFVDGAAATARYFGMPMFLVGMVVVGFGTSAPEMLVSTIAAIEGNPGIALGNAIGSNIANIGLILGVAAVISPIAVTPAIVRKEIPILLAISAIVAGMLSNGFVSRMDSVVMLGIFFSLMAWTVWKASRDRSGATDDPDSPDEDHAAAPLSRSVLCLLLGLVLLIVSSRMLVWGAVELARGFGVSDLLIGLTIVAVGTSLPELASSVVAARKGENDIAIGNVIGSNLFNTLTVIGIAGCISPMQVDAIVLLRDMPTMLALTLLLLALAYVGSGGRQTGQIGRFKGLLLLLCYVAYSVYLAKSAMM